VRRGGLALGAAGPGPPATGEAGAQAVLPALGRVAAALAALLGVNRGLPAVGPDGLALLGALLLAPEMWRRSGDLPPAGSAPRSPATPEGSLAAGQFQTGILLGGAAPLLLLAVGPLFGPSPGWSGELAAAFLVGRALAAATGKHGGRWNQVRLALLPPAFLGAFELLARTDAVVAAAHGAPWRLVSESGPATAAALGAVAALGLGALAPDGGRRSAPGLVLGLLCWAALPGLLGPDTAIRAAALALALPVLPMLLASSGAGAGASAGRLGRAGAAGALALSALAPVLPAPPTGPRAAAAFSQYADARALAGLRRRAFHEDSALAAGPGGIVGWRGGSEPQLWAHGVVSSLGDSAGGADAFFGHLPAVLAGSPAETLLLGLGAGRAADAARRDSRVGVRAWDPSSALRSLVRERGEWNRRVAADPMVRLLRSDPLGGFLSPRGHFGAILVDLPAPWAPGGPSSWGSRRLRRVRDALTEEGVAVFRLPLSQLSADELAMWAASLCETFPGLIAWLDPSGAEHLVVSARRRAGPVDVSVALEAWKRTALREDLRVAALTEPVDLLERAVADREALAGIAGDRRLRDPVGVAVVAGARARAGRRALPLAALAAARVPPERLFDLGTLAADERQRLSARLAAAADARADYLAMLDAWAAGDAQAALAAAERLQRRSTRPDRDLRSLVEPWIRRGDLLRGQGELESARSEYLVAAGFSPGDPQIQLRLGDVNRALARPGDAERHYQAALLASPGMEEALFGLAALRAAAGRLSEAAALLEDAEKSAPGSAPVLVDLAWVHTQMSAGASPEAFAGHLSRARALYQRAAALQPGWAQPRAGLAEVFYRQSDYERALVEVERALTLSDACQYRSIRGHVLHALERNREAERDLQEALLKCPELVEALVEMGAVLADLGRPAQAREQWERALAVDPGNGAAKANLAALAETGAERLILEEGR
jgi:tetratricopeptide (TPR) repeat protein